MYPPVNYLNLGIEFINFRPWPVLAGGGFLVVKLQGRRENLRRSSPVFMGTSVRANNVRPYKDVPRPVGRFHGAGGVINGGPTWAFGYGVGRGPAPTDLWKMASSYGKSRKDRPFSLSFLIFP